MICMPSNIQERLFFFSRPWLCAYFLNGPNAAASIAPILIRHCMQQSVTESLNLSWDHSTADNKQHSYTRGRIRVAVGTGSPWAPTCLGIATDYFFADYGVYSSRRFHLTLRARADRQTKSQTQLKALPTVPRQGVR